MNRLIKTAMLAGLITLVSPIALADDDGAIELGVGYGRYLYDLGTVDDSVGMLVLSAGYQFNEKWQAEIIYGNPDTTYLSNDADIDVDWTAVRGLYMLGDNPKLTPYVSAGFDSIDVFSGENDVVVGLGYKGISDSNYTFRIEGNYHTDRDDFSVIAMLGYHYGDSTYVAEPKDSDGDGVVDSLDACPKTPPGVKVDERGCQIMAKDSDGDGVYDADDQCPGTPAGALVDEKGCQKELEKEVSVNLEINFATNSDVVESSYDDQLKTVADFMRQYAGTQVVIEGHTDSVGRAEYNQALSERRAKSVAKALTDRFGIAASRISAVGYGEEKPMTSNGTAEGRQANRRVVAVINEKVKEKQWTK